MPLELQLEADRRNWLLTSWAGTTGEIVCVLGYYGHPQTVPRNVRDILAACQALSHLAEAITVIAGDVNAELSKQQLANVGWIHA